MSKRKVKNNYYKCVAKSGISVSTSGILTLLAGAVAAAATSVKSASPMILGFPPAPEHSKICYNGTMEITCPPINVNEESTVGIIVGVTSVAILSVFGAYALMRCCYPRQQAQLPAAAPATVPLASQTAAPGTASLLANMV